MTNVRHRSLWLLEALGDEPDAASLSETTSADVCIIGGGFVGLWTAYEIKRLAPDCDVVLLEQDICGGGASGRNGGFVLSWWAKFPSLLKLVADDVAVAICRESERAIDEIEAFGEEQPIDAQIVRGGWLWTTRTESGKGAWDDTVATLRRREPRCVRRHRPPRRSPAAAARPHTSAERSTPAAPPSSPPCSPAACAGHASRPGCGCTKAPACNASPVMPGRSCTRPPAA